MDSAAELPACLPRDRLEGAFNDFKPPALPPRPTVALCGSEAEVAYVSGARDLDPNVLVALTPQASCECEMRGLDYLKLEDFYDVRAFVDADEPMLAFQARWADQVDGFVWGALPQLEQVGLGPAGNYVFFLKVLIDTLYRAAFEISHLMLAGEPLEILHFESSPSDTIPETLFFDGPVYGAVLPHVAAVYGAKLVPLRCVAPDAGRTRRAPALRAAIAGLLPERALWRRRAGTQRGPRGRPAPLRRRPEVVGQWLYDVGYAAEALERLGYRVTSLRPWLSRRSRPARGLQRALDDLWPHLESEAFFGEAFRWAGVDLRPVAQTRLERWWFELVPAMWDALCDSRRRFERRRPKAVVVYSPFTASDHGRLQAARSLGIPTCTFQHGGFEGYCEYITYDLTDMRLADYRLVYGPGCVSYLAERAAAAAHPERRAEPIATGSPRLDVLRSRQASRSEARQRLGIEHEEPLVGYIGCGYTYTWYVSRCGYTATAYFELLVRAAEVIGRQEDRQVLYKTFPQEPVDPLVRLLAERCPNVTVVHGTPFVDVLPALDACVIDFPATPLIEALLSPKPILALADSRFVTLRPEGRELLERRVTVSDEPGDFLSKLEHLLADGSFADLTDPDDSFLRAYGSYLDDGRSAEHAARAVETIIDRAER